MMMMKIRVTIVEDYEYDEKKELKRLKKLFKGEQLQRQLVIFNHFLNQEWDQMKEAYHALPYDEEEECAEQEYVGMWSSIIFGGWGNGEYLKDTYRTVEFN